MVSNEEIYITKVRDLLLDIKSNPDNYLDNENIKLSLKSQGKLAAFEDAKLSIEMCSLNTFKAYAREYLSDKESDGFDIIDQLRKDAILKLEKPPEDVSENTKTITGAKRKSDRLQSELDNVREQNFLLSIIIKEMKAKMKELAESTSSVAKRSALYKEFDEKLEFELSYTLRNEVANNEIE